MIYQGEYLCVQSDAEGIANLAIDLPHTSANTLGRSVLLELEAALAAIEDQADAISGLMLSSAKESFIVGADITEFTAAFALPEEELLAWLSQVNGIFCRLERLPLPTLAAVNGLALGGGLELCLACDFRLLAEGAKVGLPEVKLGLMPGFGGSVRLPRLIGADNAIEWICAGREYNAEQALAQGLATAVVSAEQLDEQARSLLLRAARREIDYRAHRQPKLEPLTLGQMENLLCFESAKAVVLSKAGPHYPAPKAALKQLQKTASKSPEKALEMEAKAFVQLAKTAEAHELIGLFLADQKLKRALRAGSDEKSPLRRAAVLGAGIMGGGIAHQFASRGVPVVLRDIRQEALDQGIEHCAQLLLAKVERGRLAPRVLAESLGRIQATTQLAELAPTDLVVEAVVERASIKEQVLAELETTVGPDTLITSNTSTISITRLAQALKRPERFCGMHFFNPVHRMPLVEVIRGDKSSESCIKAVANAARRLGKVPVVVNDCPGFLVNRILFPYLGAFFQLLEEGQEIAAIDHAMEAFGWPMGPAALLDVVGLDTALHAQRELSSSYPERMAVAEDNLLAQMVGAGLLGQKNGRGFYCYNREHHSEGLNPELEALLPKATAEPLTQQTLEQRLLLPLCFEAARCLEEGVADCPEAVDLALVYGLGFPPFRGGALRYLDRLGAAEVCAIAEPLAGLGAAYALPERINMQALECVGFYGQETAAKGGRSDEL